MSGTSFGDEVTMTAVTSRSPIFSASRNEVLEIEENGISKVLRWKSDGENSEIIGC